MLKISKKSIIAVLFGLIVPGVCYFGFGSFFNNETLLEIMWDASLSEFVFYFSMYLSLFTYIFLFFLKERFLTHFLLFLGGTIVADLYFLL